MIGPVNTPEEFARRRKEAASESHQESSKEGSIEQARARMKIQEEMEKKFASKEYRKDKFELGKNNSLAELEGAAFALDSLGEATPEKSGKMLNVLEFGIQTAQEMGEQMIGKEAMEALAKAMRAGIISYIESIVSKNLYSVNKNDRLDPIVMGSFSLSIFHGSSDKVTGEKSENRLEEIKKLALANKLTLSFGKGKEVGDLEEIIINGDEIVLNKVGERNLSSERPLTKISGKDAAGAMIQASEKIVETRSQEKGMLQQKREETERLKKAAA